MSSGENKKNPTEMTAGANVSDFFDNDIVAQSECYVIPYQGWMNDLFALAHTRNKGNPMNGPKPPTGWQAYVTPRTNEVLFASNTQRISNQKGLKSYWGFRFPSVNSKGNKTEWLFPKLSQVQALMLILHYWRWCPDEVDKLEDIPGTITIPLEKFETFGSDDKKCLEFITEFLKVFSMMRICGSPKKFNGYRLRNIDGSSFCLFEKKRQVKNGQVTFKLSNEFLEFLDRNWRTEKKLYGSRIVTYLPKSFMEIDPRQRKTTLCAFELAYRYSMNTPYRDRISLKILKDHLLYGHDRHWLTPGDTGRSNVPLPEILENLMKYKFLTEYDFTGNDGRILPDPRKLITGNLIYKIDAIDKDSESARKALKSKRIKKSRA